MQYRQMSKNKAFPEYHRTMGALLRIPYQQLNQTVYSQLDCAGFKEIRPAHSVVFRHITPEGLRITELAELAGITKQSMASLVDYLEKYRYVKIEPDPADGRAKRVRLTKRGEAVQKEAMRLSHEVEQYWAGLVGKKEFATLRGLLEKLYDSIDH